MNALEWVPFLQYTQHADYNELRIVEAVVQCRRIVEVRINPTPKHKGTWFCAKAPIPKKVRDTLSSEIRHDPVETP